MEAPVRMKYDDASWHYGGDFPNDLPNEAGATHIGMFLAWALLAGLGGEIFADELAEEVGRLRIRAITPGAFFFSVCDGKFIDEDLNELGNAFALDYYESESADFIPDYDATLAVGLPSTYHVPDSWESYDKLKPVIDKRFAQWQSSRPVNSH